MIRINPQSPTFITIKCEFNTCSYWTLEISLSLTHPFSEILLPGNVPPTTTIIKATFSNGLSPLSLSLDSCCSTVLWCFLYLPIVPAPDNKAPVHSNPGLRLASQSIFTSRWIRVSPPSSRWPWKARPVKSCPTMFKNSSPAALDWKWPRVREWVSDANPGAPRAANFQWP